MVALHQDRIIIGSLANGSQFIEGTLEKEKVLSGMLGVGFRQVESDAVVRVNNRLDLPTVGNPQNIYFVIGENAVYRWDEEKLLYFCVGRDYEEISLINGGTANE